MGLFVVGVAYAVVVAIGMLGYGVGLPIAALVLSRFFYRNEDS